MAGKRFRPARGHLPDTLQLNRRANLRLILHELEGDGIESALLIDQVLGLPAGTSASLRKGADVTDSMAREIEWAMNRPVGWLDRGARDDRL
ncbi:hypothetical protein ABIE56_002385 [Luteibacter sp. 621]|jgi:hypothetical protein|uniref:hypothetical protein n=1 Tax=Luteibacter sp. 621 TaxID=3373916 RepID=UPI003D22F5AA